MKYLDKFLQDWRINKAIAHIPPNSDVLDIGCFDAELFKKLGSKIHAGIGVDPLVREEKGERYELKQGYFPDVLPKGHVFDAITMLAVLEHIPNDTLEKLSQACFDHLKPKGKLIITVPDAKVDRILEVLKFLRLIHGMSLEEHHGFQTNHTKGIFEKVGLKLAQHTTFQLGLNNLFVFERPA